MTISTAASHSSLSALTEKSSVVETLERDAAPLDGIDLDFNPRLSLLWITLRPKRHCISSGFLAAMHRLIDAIKANSGAGRNTRNQAIKYVAYRSVSPDVFLYGADFDIFLESIRTRNPKPLREYAYGCIDLCWENLNLIGGNIPTIAVVEGATYGGGFEAAASCNVVIARDSAQFQLPEIRFSTFPGLAYSIVGRRAPLQALHQLVMTAGVWNGETAKELGVVDVLTTGDPSRAAEDYVASVLSRHAAHCGALRAMNRVRNITRTELNETIDDWIKCTMDIPAQAVHVVTKLLEAQNAMRPATISRTAT
ncbi:enoyl-CoA hydratase/isomerase family protein [Rhodoblastus acidophilus]|uniref:Enoyl-CoA hydratase/isomerase family protein n=1 Tax=Candidatus Rhodoblastus alkanivorans TaxID=2954117 RepID=A0ABS9Z963_9HYPH|nr:crotonase/enoyl-CoA hydratase family protein [Candidatus Rhodoblastus alkanivorans]MCI4680342.1 enoyl-CoA hydratase/isomerase family protein [Candidatus Rhodoblastus alkanivorans]MCI4684005.1 enoyl-CoA hydratase/isomerase family protein [Candidatus Rhodoblastus alkanivorans]MDI4641324.1 enoyl-CoA hydratase/isomerase family protein [Rhodoblastus acidophilus]